MKAAIFATNPDNIYSGGRYASLVMAECLASRGHKVYYVTNNEPLFFKDFEINENHRSINLIITDSFSIKPPERRFDVVILIPHQNPNPHFYNAVRYFAHLTKAHLVLFNFETPNWFNKYSPVKRNENTWDQWKKCCEQGCLVLSMNRESQKYAREYYTDNPGLTYFDYWYPAINSLAADKITVPREEKRIVIITRLEDKHKGSDDILEIIDRTLAGYTLVFILGRGTIPDEYLRELENLAQEFNIFFEIKHRLSDEEKFKEIKRARAMLFPSYFEGYGYPPLEALYCGTPCVAYDLPVLRETCRDGILYAKTGDINEFKEKIKLALTLHNDEGKYPGAAVPGTGSFTSGALQLEEVLLKFAEVKLKTGKVPIFKPNFFKRLYRFLKRRKNRIKNLLSRWLKRQRKAPFRDASLKYGLSEIKRTGNNELMIKGWVFAGEKIDAVLIYADSKFLGQLPVNLNRLDVLNKFTACDHPDCGFSGLIPLLSPPVFKLVLKFYARGVLLAIIERKVDLSHEDSLLPGAGTRPAASWLSLKIDDSPKMRRRVELANQGKGLTQNDRRIGALYNKHKGEIAFLLGNGPSVRVEDLEKLQGSVTFGCNRLYLAYDRMDFRPTYLCSSDSQMIRDFGAEMVEKHPGTVLFISKERPGIAGDFTWFEMKSRTPLEFSENVYDFVMPGGGTLITAIQIGYHMGITRFVLYGVDHHFHYEKNGNAQSVLDSAKGDGNHFIPGYRSGKPWTPPQAFQVEGAFLSCHVFLQSKGGWIKNATRGGKLEILERIDLDEIVPGAFPEGITDKKISTRGKIKWYTQEKQFGFVQPDQGERFLFVHKKFISSPGLEDFEVGTPVCYEPYEGPKGLEARNLHVLEGETAGESQQDETRGLSSMKNRPGALTYQEQNFTKQESNLFNKLLFGLAPLFDDDMEQVLKSDDYFAAGVYAKDPLFLEFLEQRYRMPVGVVKILCDYEQRNWVSSIKNRTAPGHILSLRDQILLRLETYKRNREALLQLISLFDIPTRALFDVGFQFGFLLLAAVQEGFGKIAGAEINKGLTGFVNELKRYIETNYNIDGTYCFGDFAKLEFEPRGFNLVTCVDVLEHTPDLPKTMENMQKICSPGGMIYIYQGNGQSLMIATFEPHYQLPCLSILPVELAVEVMTHLGNITGKTRYLVKQWPTLPEISRCLTREDTHFEVYNTDVNIRNNAKYPGCRQLEMYISKFRHTAEEKLLPRLSGFLKKEVRRYMKKYFEEIEKDKKNMKEIDFKKKYLMHSWNIILRPAR